MVSLMLIASNATADLVALCLLRWVSALTPLASPTHKTGWSIRPWLHWYLSAVPYTFGLDH
jgi:hypothetical protein